MSKAPAIGIDLGTTYSCVGVFQHGKVEIIANDHGNRTTPSYVSFTDYERHIGEAAKNEIAINPTNTVFDAKRLIGRTFQDEHVQADMKHWPFTVVNVDGSPSVQIQRIGKRETFTAEEIGSMVLGKMKATAEAYLGCEVTDAVITVPAYFNDSQRQATKDAGAIAGLNVLRIINEPTAAAMAYGLDKKVQDKRNILIYDLGGGTFDVSILTIENGSEFTVRAVAGDTHLGGEDFDSRLVNHLMSEFKRKYNVDISENQRAVRRLRTAAETAKRTLSGHGDANIAIDSLYSGIDFYTKISKARFVELCADLFQKTLESVESALKDSALSKNMIHDVVLVGGSTRIPRIQQQLEQFFGGKQLNSSINPDEAVAYGAAIQAALLNGDTVSFLRDVVLIDVTPLSLGIKVKGTIMSNVIKRNTIIPCKCSEVFLTACDYQTRVNFSIYEGERPMVKDNNLLGSFCLTGIPSAPAGEKKLDTSFELDENGILTVIAMERSTGNANGIVISKKGRLSVDQIRRMRQDAVRYKEEDEKVRKSVEARNQFENYIYCVKRAVEDANDKLDTSEINSIREECKIILQWLDDNWLAEQGEIENKKKFLQNLYSSTLSKLFREGVRIEEVD